jgi:hypothetical protein
MCLIHSTFDASAQATNVNITPYLGVQNFRWIESEDYGERIVEESGFLNTVQLQSQLLLTPQKKVLFEVDIRYSFGKTNYDGYLLLNDGNQTPFKTNTGYSGIEASVLVGYAVTLSNGVRLYPLAGTGLEFWQRHLDKGGSMGYTENFRVFHANVGLRAEYSPSKHIEISTSGMVKQPLSAFLTIPIQFSDNTEVSELHLILPKNSSWQFNAGIKIFNFSIEAYYDTWELGKSSEDRGFYLPTTNRTRKGIIVGYSISIAK